MLITYDGKYIAYVKDDSSWISYSDETQKEELFSVSFDCIPYFAIYKGIQ